MLTTVLAFGTLALHFLLSAVLNRRFYVDLDFDSYRRYLPSCEVLIGTAKLLSPNMKGAKESCVIEIWGFLGWILGGIVVFERKTGAGELVCGVWVK